MAKKIDVSDDNGVTWYTLPGGTGEYTEEADAVTDTIFGNTYESSEVGLISWSVSANAYYKGFAGYFAKVLKPGTSTAATNEATTLVSGKTYQITNASRRVMDRSQTITVYDNGVAVADSDIDSFDYLFGKVTFAASYTVTGPVTITYNYFPMVSVGTASSFTLTQTANMIDTTDFATAQSNSGFRTFQPGLRTVSVDLSGFFNASNAFKSALEARSEVVIEINPDGSGNSLARGFFKPSNWGQSGDVGALEEETITYSLNIPDDAKLAQGFSWEHSASTTLSTAVQKILNAWLTESTSLQVRYLYDGTSGYSGVGIVSDVSLEGSLDGMNVFTANFQGSGQPTTI